MFECDGAEIVTLAKNLTSLTSASIQRNALGAHIVNSLQSYSALVDLSVFELDLEHFFWSPTTTNLTSIKWVIPGQLYYQASPPSIRHLMKIV
jgi:hypothetical protein